MRDGCPFCDYDGPSPVLEERSEVIIFEPLRPVVPGHVLAVPLAHAGSALVNPLLTGRVFAVAASYAREHSGSCNLIASCGHAATQTVGHLHVHVVPRRRDDGLHLPWTSTEEPR